MEQVQLQLQIAQGNDGYKVYSKYETVLNKNSKTYTKNTKWRMQEPEWST